MAFGFCKKCGKGIYSVSEFAEPLGETYCNKCVPGNLGTAPQQVEPHTLWEGIKERSKKIVDGLTGHTIEKELDLYSETYGEILLGMHRDLERHQTLIKEHDQNMREGVARVSQVHAQLGQAVVQAESHSKDASRLSEEAKSAALAAGASAKESKEELERTKDFLNDVQRKWQALLSMVESQRQEIRTLDSPFRRMVESQGDEICTLDLTFKRFRTRVMWSGAAVALAVIMGGLAWIVHFFR